MESFLTALGPTQSLEAMEVLFSLSVSFVLGLVLATVYRWTHQGFSYGRSFLHTMVLATIVITVMIMAIGNNMARGLGILGAMAFVRFRTPIRDPRDIIFLFAALSIGIASGAQVFGVAIIGTFTFALLPFFLVGHLLLQGVNLKGYYALCCLQIHLPMTIFRLFSRDIPVQQKWSQCEKRYKVKFRNIHTKSV